MSGSAWNRLLLLATLVLASRPIDRPAYAQADARRQYYTPWKYSKPDGYYYCYYRYKPARNDATHQHHFVIYYPGHNWMYFYNPAPEKKSYWCRAYKDVTANGGKIWAVLPAKSRVTQLGKIDPDVWRTIEPSVPLIPDSDKTGDLADKAEMIAPDPLPMSK
jgi:hypothetical protein